MKGIDVIALKTEDDTYFPIDNSFWEWRAKNKRIKINDFYLYADKNEIDYVIDELEKTWPKKNENNQIGYEKTCFKHNIHKSIVLATMLRGLHRHRIKTQVITKPERFERYPSIFSDMHRSSTEQILFYKDFEELSYELNTLKEIKAGELYDIKRQNQEGRIESLIIASSVSNLSSYKFKKDSYTYVYIDNLPAWEQINAEIGSAIKI